MIFTSGKRDIFNNFSQVPILKDLLLLFSKKLNMSDKTVRVLNIVQVVVIWTSSGPPFVVFWKLLIHMPSDTAGLWSRYYIILSQLYSICKFSFSGIAEFTEWTKFSINKPVEIEEAVMSNLLFIWHLIRSKVAANSVAFNSTGRHITMKKQTEVTEVHKHHLASKV